MTPVLMGKDLVLEGSFVKIEDKQVPGIYTWIFQICTEGCFTKHPFNKKWLFGVPGAVYGDTIFACFLVLSLFASW